MRWISKGVEPDVLANYRISGEKFGELSIAKGKGVIQKQLLGEQGHNCAYCTRSITAENMKLEHWWPQNRIPPDRTLDFTNMLACCSGISGHGAFRHCDTSKGGTEINFDPQLQTHVSTISYGKTSGEMISSDASLNTDLDDQDRLNLNCKPLIEKRGERITELRDQLRLMNKRNKTINFAKMLKSYLDKRTPFDDIIVDYLQKKVAKGL